VKDESINFYIHSQEALYSNERYHSWTFIHSFRHGRDSRGIFPRFSSSGFALGMAREPLTGWLSPGFAIQIIPAEWTGERFDYNESWQNSYMARLGFVFNLC
jgi:hypothetical protein